MSTYTIRYSDVMPFNVKGMVDYSSAPGSETLSLQGSSIEFRRLNLPFPYAIFAYEYNNQAHNVSILRAGMKITGYVTGRSVIPEALPPDPDLTTGVWGADSGT